MLALREQLSIYLLDRIIKLPTKRLLINIVVSFFVFMTDTSANSLLSHPQFPHKTPQ